MMLLLFAVHGPVVECSEGVFEATTVVRTELITQLIQVGQGLAVTIVVSARMVVEEMETALNLPWLFYLN